MTLPLKTVPQDLLRVVEFLRNKVAGSTIAEASNVLGKKLLDGRKLNAYVTWGFVSSAGDSISLTDLGWELARASEDQAREVLCKALATVPAYTSVLEWAYHQQIQEPTVIEVAGYWHENYRSELVSDKETTLRDTAICFFHLCQAARLGRLVVGRRGQPTRFEMSRPSLGRFVQQSPVAARGADRRPLPTEDQAGPDATEPEPGRERQELPDRAERLKVFISHSKNRGILEQIKTMLGFAGLEYRVADEEQSTAIPVPEKVLKAMRDCTAAAICVTADETEKREDGSYGINENVLIEIGAAFVLYDQRVVLVWDRRVPVPSNLQGLYRSEFEGQELSWSEGMKFMEALNNFRAGNTPPG